jgi:DNA-binding PadR family transcriptional regulator
MFSHFKRGGPNCRGPFNWHGGPFGPRGRGGRMFDSGALRLVVLGLIAEQPRHGYDIIRALKERFQGAYSPSPGSIYPMLQLLQDAGLVTAAEEGSKRLISVTEAGLDYLADHAAELAKLRERMEQAAAPMGEAAIGAVVAEFRHALMHRLRQGNLSPEQVDKLASILKKTQEEIERI